MQKLGAQGIDSILLEGGAMLNWSAINSGIVQKVQAYIAPKIVGGEHAKTPVGGQGIFKMSEAIHLKNIKVQTIGEDFLIEGDVDRKESEANTFVYGHS